MMMRQEDLMQFTPSNPAGAKAYAKWLEDPVTIAAIAMVEEMNRPFLPIGADQTTLAVCHAAQCGLHNGLRQLTQLGKITTEVVDVAATYGSEDAIDNLRRKKK